MDAESTPGIADDAGKPAVKVMLPPLILAGVLIRGARQRLGLDRNRLGALDLVERHGHDPLAVVQTGWIIRRKEVLDPSRSCQLITAKDCANGYKYDADDGREMETPAQPKARTKAQ
jgi:hypothetical protein